MLLTAVLVPNMNLFVEGGGRAKDISTQLLCLYLFLLTGNY